MTTRPYQAMVKAEEIEALASIHQVDDPRLGRLRLQAEVGEQRREPRQGSLGLRSGAAHHYQVIGIPDQGSARLVLPGPVKPVQATTRATARSHWRDGALSSSSGKPRSRKVPRAAATCPWGRLHATSNATASSPKPPSGGKPLRPASNAASFAGASGSGWPACASSPGRGPCSSPATRWPAVSPVRDAGHIHAYHA